MSQTVGAKKAVRNSTVRKSTAPLSRTDGVINLRTDAATRSLIDNAAEMLGQNRTEFMLTSARARAKEVLLDRTHIVLSDADWAVFQRALNAPAEPTDDLIRLLATPLSWSD